MESRGRGDRVSEGGENEKKRLVIVRGQDWRKILPTCLEQNSSAHLLIIKREDETRMLNPFRFY
jgi:hypothetical protein